MSWGKLITRMSTWLDGVIHKEDLPASESGGVDVKSYQLIPRFESATTTGGNGSAVDCHVALGCNCYLWQPRADYAARHYA